MMSLASCLSFLVFFVELVENLVGGVFPDMFQNSVYRLIFFSFSLFSSNNLYIRYCPDHCPDYRSLDITVFLLPVSSVSSLRDCGAEGIAKNGASSFL